VFIRVDQSVGSLVITCTALNFRGALLQECGAVRQCCRYCSSTATVTAECRQFSVAQIVTQVAERGGMNRSPPYAATIPANGTRAQVLATPATSNGSGSAQGTPRDAVPRATMKGQHVFKAGLACKKSGLLRVGLL